MGWFRVTTPREKRDDTLLFLEYYHRGCVAEVASMLTLIVAMLGNLRRHQDAPGDRLTYPFGLQDLAILASPSQVAVLSTSLEVASLA
jgi:hypothetical protein